MKRQYHTPEGIVEKELTDKEIVELAKTGDVGARRELFKRKWGEADTVDKRIELIRKMLTGETP